MPHRTGLSHATLTVALVVLWVFFERSLSVIVHDEHVVAAVEYLARLVHETTGLSVTYGTVVTMVTVALVIVLAFAWGYAFHLQQFGRGP